MSSPDKERDISNIQTYVDHLSGIRFNGTLLIVFEQGALKYVSRKEELSADLLDRFLHRPVIVKTKRPAEMPKVEIVECAENAEDKEKKTPPEEPGKF